MKQIFALVVTLVLGVSCTATLPAAVPSRAAPAARQPADTPPATGVSGESAAVLANNGAGARRVQGDVYYVALDGDDDDPGTEAQPFSTISKGASVVQAGDLLYVRGGTYHEQVSVSASGTETSPITVAAYPGEQPVIDGQKSLPPGEWNCLLCLTGEHLVVDGLHVANSTGYGIKVPGNYNRIQGVNVHHNYRSGILVTGDNNLVESSTVWSNCMSNENGQQYPGGWPAALTAARYPSHTTIRDNTVHNNWGEGISTLEAQYTTIEDNVVYDNYSANIYVDNAAYVLVQRNLVYATGNPEFDRAPGICCADEDYGDQALSHHNTIVNNLVLGGNRTFFYFGEVPDSGLKQSLIAHNTFVNSDRVSSIRIVAGAHQDTRFENNIFLQEDDLAIADVVNDPELAFSHNLWSKAPPAHVSSPDDVIGDPRLAKTGPTGPGLLTPEWFKLLASSPAIERGKVLAEVRRDFFRTLRSSPPDIGAHEAPFSFRVSDLRVVEASGGPPSLTVTLNWTAPIAAVTYTLRSSDTFLTLDNWDEASLVPVPFTASVPGSSEWLVATVDHTGGTRFFALKSQDEEGAWSPLSNNAFWTRWDIYLPLVPRN